MNLAFNPHDNIDSNLTMAARYMALAVAELRNKGEIEYATVIQTHLHGLERPHWLESSPSPQVLPGISSRICR
jgi:hypothetical protein